MGTHFGACPYFTMRKLAHKADLVFAPYAYVLDPAVRQATKIDLGNAVVIFDEVKIVIPYLLGCKRALGTQH